MNVHENVRTTRHSRMLIVDRLHAGWSIAAIAQAIGVTPKTVRNWRNRFAARRVDGVNLRRMLGEIQADDCDFQGGWLLVPVALTATCPDTEMS